MGLEDLKRHLESRARDEAREILEAAGREADAIRARIIEEARREAGGYAEIVAEAERRARGAVVQADRDASRILGEAYGQVLEMAVGRALDRLRGLSGSEYRAFLQRCLDRGDAILGTYEITASREEDVEHLTAAGHRVTGVDPGAGGILMTAPDGRVLDLRFESLIDRMRPGIWRLIVGGLGEVDASRGGGSAGMGEEPHGGPAGEIDGPPGDTGGTPDDR